MSLHNFHIAIAFVISLAPALGAQPPKTASVSALKLEFVQVEPGEFSMGSSTGMNGELPPHKVRISRGFDLGKYEVTQAQWQALMGSNTSRFAAPDRPVDSVSWENAQEFLKRLNASDSAHHYRLPTEAEWEYAARAGTTGDYPGELEEIAWYYSNSNLETHPVGRKKPNPWGLYDMHGNVWEWCQDWFNTDYYGTSPTVDTPRPAEGVNKVLRGGSWGANANYTRSSVRISFFPGQKNSYFGFRILRQGAK